MKFLFVLLFAALCWTQQLTIDLNGVSSDLKEKLIKNQLHLDSVKVEQGSGWKDIAQNIGKAVAELCSSLNVSVNEFAKTPVGKLTLALLVWKIIGAQVLGIILAFGIYLFVVGILYFYVWHFHMRERRVEDGKVSYVRRYEFDDDDYKVGSAICCWTVFIVATISLAISVGAQL